jgi:D-amino-acid dehydrogenase
VRAEPGRPRRVAVVGAGLVGLSTAWFLQEHGLDVTVLERDTVASGASWGNAGWITPAMVAPLPDPVILREALRALARRSPGVYVPLPPGPSLLAFLGAFARNCTPRRWQAGLAALGPLSRHALGSFDALAAGGVRGQTVAGEPVLAAYPGAVQREPLLTELREVSRRAGPTVDFDVLDGEAVRRAEPALTSAAQAAVRINGQRYTDPAPFTRAVADSARLRGAEIREHAAVTSVRGDDQGVTVTTSAGESRHDAVVLATGAWLGDLTAGLGIRTKVRSGRGYSFVVPVRQLPAGPVYLPAQRLACTPTPDGRLRVAGVMEFRPPAAPLDRGRVARIADGMHTMLAGADTASRTQEWVGARPCTADGLPVIGRTRSPRIFVAGGHGMWGITLGPATGRLLARAVAAGSPAPELRPFDPLR